VLLAPFPWSPRRLLHLLRLPAILLCYVARGAVAVVVARGSASWRRLAPLVLFIVGTMTVFVLAEGNVGTLFRHRAMVVPFVLILAAPTLASALTVVVGRFRPLSQSRGPELAQ